MKILFATDIYFPTPGGMSVVIKKLAEELVKRGHEVSIIAPSTSWKMFKEVQEGITIYRVQAVLILKEKRIWYAPAYIYKNEIRSIIKRVKPDVIHVETADAVAKTTIDVAREKGIPLVGTCHFMGEHVLGTIPFFPKGISKVVENLYMKEAGKVFNKLDFLIVPTPMSVKMLQDNGVTIPIHPISNGIDLTFFHRAKKEEAEVLRKKLNLPNVPIILYVGRVDLEKDLDVLIRALPHLQKHMKVHTVIAGKGETLKELQEFVTSLHLDASVSFLGFLEHNELLALYSLGSVFAIPSTSETQSLVTMEAMAIGMPVVAANAGALPYLVKHNENGYLFTPGNPKDLAEKLEKILENPTLAQEMSKRGKEMIQEHDITRIITHMEEIYAQVIETVAQKNRALPRHKFLQSVYSFITPEKV